MDLRTLEVDSTEDLSRSLVGKLTALPHMMMCEDYPAMSP